MYFLYMRATCLEHDQSKQDMAIFSLTFESFDLKKNIGISLSNLFLIMISYMYTSMMQ